MRFTTRATALIGAVCLLGTMTAMPAAAAFPEDTLKGTFCQSTVTVGENRYGIETYSYSDSYFAQGNSAYQPQLAAASAYLAMASATSGRIDDTHAADRDIIAFLEDIGFSGAEANEDFRIEPTPHTMGVACGYKCLTDADGNTCTLLAVAPRGAGYGAEWASNFRLGKEGNASGFAEGSEKVNAFLRDYIQKHGITGEVRIWLTGYSRAGAVADLTAAALIDDAAAVLGDAVTLLPEHLYAYTFEAPRAADTANQPRDARYSTIYNILSRNDAIPCIAPERLGFERFGTDRYVEDSADYDDMLLYLKNIHPSLFLGYRFGYSPLDFQKRQLGMAVDGSTGEYPADLTGSNQLPETQAAFAQLLADSLAGSVADRADYAENVEPYLSELAGLLIPPLLSDSEQMSKAASGSRYALPLLVYLYMDYELSRIPYVIEEYPDDPAQVELFFNKSNRLALLLRAMMGDFSEQDVNAMEAFIHDLKPDEQVWIQDVFGDFSPEALEEAKVKTGFSEWEISPECVQEMRDIFDLYTSYMTPDGDRFTSYTSAHYAEETAFVKERLTENYKGFMAEFLTAFGAPEEVVTHQTEAQACRSIPPLIESLLLDSPNRADRYAEDIEDSESVGKLATLLGNQNNLLYAHSMGAILAWVRAEDSEYTDFAKTPIALRYGYRRLRLDSAVSGRVYDEAGELLAAFRGSTLLFSQNEWIRTDARGLRLPVNQTYTVELTADEPGPLSVQVEEYSTYDGCVMNTVTSDAALDWSGLRIAAGDVYTLTLPLISDPSEHWAGSTDYTLRKTQAAPVTDPVTEPTTEPIAEPATDPTTEPLTEPSSIAQYSNEALCEMAARDYRDKTGAAVSASPQENADGTLSVTLTDAQGQTLDVYTVSPNTGTGTNRAGERIDLPQTGTRSPGTLLSLLAALGAVASGAWLVRRNRPRKS